METGKLAGNMEQMVNWGDRTRTTEDIYCRKYGNNNNNKPSKLSVT